jgi:hypothetical protein
MLRAIAALPSLTSLRIVEGRSITVQNLLRLPALSMSLKELRLESINSVNSDLTEADEGSWTGVFSNLRSLSR